MIATITTLTSVMTLIGIITSTIAKGRSDLANVTIAGGSVTDSFKVISNVVSKGTRKTLISISKILTVSPQIIISDKLKNVEVINNIATTGLEIFVAHYVQAFNVLTTVGSIEPGKAMNVISSLEAHDDKADLSSLADQTYKFLPLNPETDYTASMDKDNTVGNKIVGPSSIIGYSVDLTVDKVTTSEDNTVNKTKISIPILFRTTIMFTKFKSIMFLASIFSEKTSFKQRLNEYRSGGISFSDFIFASDLIRKYKSGSLSTLDNDEFHEYVRDNVSKKETSEVKRAIKSGTYVDASKAVIVVTKSEQVELESLFAGKFAKDNVINKFFAATSSLFLMVVDVEWENVTLYTRNITGSTVLSFSDLQGKSKTDLTDLYKSLLLGSQPTF